MQVHHSLCHQLFYSAHLLMISEHLQARLVLPEQLLLLQLAALLYFWFAVPGVAAVPALVVLVAAELL